MTNALPKTDIPVTRETEAFWAGLAAGHLDIAWCEACDGHVWPPRSHCVRCLSVVEGTKRLSGEGEIYSFSIVHRGEGPFADAAPYVLAYVRVDGGPTIMANVVDIEPGQVRVGMRVRLASRGDEPGSVGALFAPLP